MQEPAVSGILTFVQQKLTAESVEVWHPRSRYYGRYIVGLLTAVNAINYLDRMVVVTMYDDLRRIFDFSNGQLGALSSGFFAVHALATLPLGWASDRFDRRRVMAAGVLLWSAATLFSAYAVGFVSMFLLRAVVGVGEAAYGPASNAILCEVDRRRKARLNAIYNGGMFAGACAGLYLGGLLGFPLAFKLVAIPGFALSLLIFVLDVPPHRADLPDKRAPSMAHVAREMVDGIRRTLAIPTLRWMLASGTLISFAAGGYSGPMPAVIDDVVDASDATRAQASFIPFLHILGTGPSAVIMGAVSENPAIGLRWAFVLPAAATLLAGLCALRASHWVSADMEARSRRAAHG
jgi:MFS family permease